MPEPHRGRTLIEVLVAVAVVAVLLGLLLTAAQKLRTRAARLRDENNLRQIGLACQSYAAQNSRLPPTVGNEFPHKLSGATGPAGDPVNVTTRHQVSAAVYLMPLLDGPPLAANLYQKPDPPLRGLVVPVYVSSLDGTNAGGRLDLEQSRVISENRYRGVGNYAFNVQVLGRRLDYPSSPRPADKTSLGNGIPDGTSNTLLLATRQAVCGVRTRPGSPPERVWYGGSLFASAVFLMDPTPPPDAAPTVGAFFGTQVPAADGAGPTFQTAVTVADCNPQLAHGYERGVIVTGLADGSTRTVRVGIDPKVWRAALLPSDGSGLPAE